MKYKILIFLAVVGLAVVYFRFDSDVTSSLKGPVPNTWMMQQRAWPHSSLNHQARKTALSQARDLFNQARNNKNAVLWQPVSQRGVHGRITDVAISPNGDIFSATASGGAWRSIDDGANWISLSDDWGSLSMSDIEIAPSDPNTIYIGTGEANGGGGSLTYPGDGVYKSTDGGVTWEQAGLPDSQHIGRLAVHPENPEIVYAGVMGAQWEPADNRGLYRTTDGGETWSRIHHIDDGVSGVIEVLFDPHDANRLYFATWERTRQPDNLDYGGPNSKIMLYDIVNDATQELMSGLNGSEFGRIGMAASPSEPGRIYAFVNTPSGNLAGLFRSNDSGANWSATNDLFLKEDNATGGFGWWFGNVRVHPTNPDYVVFLGLRPYWSFDGGATWKDIFTVADANSVSVHVDQHALDFYPDSDRFILGNDGGLYLSDTDNISFTTLNTPPSAQFYTCEIGPNTPPRYYGGLQDNGSQFVDQDSDLPWTPFWGGDGFVVHVQPGNPDSFFAESQFGNLVHYVGSQRFRPRPGSALDRWNWQTPHEFDPHNPNSIYVGSQTLWKATNFSPNIYPFEAISPDLTKGATDGNREFGTITAIAPSPADAGVVWCGTDDGNVQVTQNGGDSWTLVSDNLPQRWVTSIAAHPSDANTAYVTYSGYRFADPLPHVFKTTDGGQSWTDISGNLPEAPVNKILLDPLNSTTLYAASDFGVYISRNDGAVWSALGVGLPLIVATDLDISDDGSILAAATFGRGMYRIDLEAVRDQSLILQAPFQYGVTHILRGDEDDTSITLINHNEESTTATLRFFDNGGNQLEVIEQLLQPGNSRQLSLNSLRGFETNEAWVRVDCDRELIVTAHTLGQEALSVWSAPRDDAPLVYVPHVARDTNQFKTVIASANTSENVLGHNIIPNLNETPVAIDPLTTPYAHVEGDVRQWLGDDLSQIRFAQLQTLQGSVASMEYFLTQPNEDRKAALGLTGDSATTLRFLHIAGDTQNFWTGLVYINIGDQTATITRTFYAPDGQIVTQDQNTLEPGEKITLLRDQSSSQIIPDGAAWMELNGDQNLIGYELFGSSTISENSFFAGLQSAIHSGTRLHYPDFKTTDTWWSGIVAVNTGENSASITFTVYDSDGAALESRTMENVPSKGRVLNLANDFFQNPETHQRGVRVSAEADGSQWSGFLLWGDHQVTTRKYIAGVQAHVE